MGAEVAFLSIEEISIHVPLAGDDIFGTAAAKNGSISIHVPLAGDDPF